MQGGDALRRPRRSARRRPIAVVCLVAIAAVPPIALIAGSERRGPAEASGAAAERSADAATPAAGQGAAPVASRPAATPPAELPPLLFSGNGRGGYELHALDPDAGRDTAPVRVTDGQALFGAWSPDGSEIAFAGEATGFSSTRAALKLIAPDGAVRELVKGPQVPSHPTFGAGGRVAYQSFQQTNTGAAAVIGFNTIDVVTTGGGTQRTLVEHRGAVYQPAFSPDGRRLAVVVGEAGCRRPRRCGQQLALRRADGRPLRTLVADGVAGAPAWSPDGRRIAFTWDRGAGPGIWTVDVADGRTRRLTGDRPAASGPTWSPDGERIAFSRGCDLHVLRIGAPRAVALTRTERVCEIAPAWRPEPAR